MVGCAVQVRPLHVCLPARVLVLAGVALSWGERLMFALDPPHHQHKGGVEKGPFNSLLLKIFLLLQLGESIKTLQECETQYFQHLPIASSSSSRYDIFALQYVEKRANRCILLQE